MKRIIIFIGLLVAAILIPVRGSDVAELQPVQVVALSREEEQVILQTDTGDTGRGRTALGALADLKATTPAVIYLDTAKYLLVSENALEDVNDLRSVLKGKVQLCLRKGPVLCEDTAEFLDIHGRLPMLKEWTAGESLPTLTTENGRLFLLKKSEKNS